MFWPPLTLSSKIRPPDSPKGIETFRSSFVSCSLISEFYSRLKWKMGLFSQTTNSVFYKSLLILQVSAFVTFLKKPLYVLSFSTISVRLVCFFIKLENAHTYTVLILPNFLTMYSKSLFRATFGTLSENPHCKY